MRPLRPSREPARVSVTIDTEHPGARIEPAIYGQFAEHLGRGIYEGIWVGEDSRDPEHATAIATTWSRRCGGSACR